MIVHGEATSDDGKTGVIPGVVSGNEASADGPTLAGSALITDKESSGDAMRFVEGRNRTCDLGDSYGERGMDNGAQC